MTTIAEQDLATTMIGETGISVWDLVTTFVDSQDGRLDHEMEDEHGFELGERVRNARNALRHVHCVV